MGYQFLRPMGVSKIQNTMNFYLLNPRYPHTVLSRRTVTVTAILATAAVPVAKTSPISLHG